MTDNNQEGQVAEQTQEVSLADELRSRFEPKEEQKEVVEVKEEQKETTEEKEGGLQEEREETTEEIETAELAEKEFPLVPKDWSAEERKAFEKLLNHEDEEVALGAALAIERYNSFKKGFNKRTQEYSAKTKELGEINQIFAPFEANLKANGLTKAQYVDSLIREAVGLHQNPAEKLKSWIKQYNLKPEQLGFDEYSYLQDEEKHDTNEIQQLKAEINTLRNQLNSAPVENQVRQFAEAKDEQGKLKHPYFSEVRGIMGNLIAKNPEMSLDQAYKKAVKTMDIEAEEAPDSDAINLDKIREKVAKSKKASKSVKSNGGKLDFSQMTLSDELKARFNGIN